MSSKTVIHGLKTADSRSFRSEAGTATHTDTPQPEFSLSVCLDCGTPIPARVLELARTDLLILTDRPLRFGTPLQLAIFSDLISAVTQNRALVHWCRPHARGWQIGAFLTQPLPDRLTGSLWTDLRSCLRYECNWKAWIRWDGDGRLEAVRIVNYSVTGFRMRTEQQTAANSEFSLFGSAGTREKAVLNGRVEWCRAVEDFWHIGCLIHGQRGRDLPRMFGNLESVHVDRRDSEDDVWADSQESRMYDLASHERFPGPAEPRAKPVSKDEPWLFD